MESVKNSTIQLSPQDINKIRGFLFNEPREISGSIQIAIEKTLERYEGLASSSIVENWYRGATVADYNSSEAAAAYLGAYGVRSILKYQEAVFALLLLKGFVPTEFTVLDYGAGPCPGFAAIIDLWVILSQITGQRLKLNYVGVDRSKSMLDIGRAFSNFIKKAADSIDISFELFSENNLKKEEADLLILSNVLNEGEGYSDCSVVIASVIEKISNLKDIVVIEPATEHSSRQMCSLTKNFKSLNHIGPCPSADVNCNEWTFREFKKRVYSFERRCAGPLAAATNLCKYSLSLLSYVTNPRTINKDEFVVARRLQASNQVLVCRHGEKQWFRSYNGSPWDLINKNRVITKIFP